MAEFGWTVPCLVGEDGELIAGHGRVLAVRPARDLVGRRGRVPGHARARRGFLERRYSID